MASRQAKAQRRTAALVLALATLIGPSSTGAQPPARPRVIGVFGDSLGDGLWAGLSQALRGGGAFQVVRFSRPATGLARYDYVNVEERARRQLAGRRIDIAVVMLGANDEQGMFAGRQVLAFDTPPWRAIYAARIDALASLLRRNAGAVYWVGLPKMRRPAYDEKAQRLNALYEMRARALGLPFVSTISATVDAQGRYSDRLIDGDGRSRLMRGPDGVHMTMAGYRRLAAPVADKIRADMVRAGPAPAGAGRPPGAP